MILASPLGLLIISIYQKEEEEEEAVGAGDGTSFKEII